MQVEDGVGGRLIFSVLRVRKKGCHGGRLVLQMHLFGGLDSSQTGLGDGVSLLDLVALATS